MCNKDLNELFDRAQITPCPEAKQKAKARMLTAAGKSGQTNLIRRITMKITEKNKAAVEAEIAEENLVKTEDESEGFNQQKNKRGNPVSEKPFFQKIKINKYHLQGAVAMLLVVSITLSALVLTPGVNLFGTLFNKFPSAKEVVLTASPATIEARADFAGETFTLSGFPENEIANIKPEHIFLGGYLGGLSVTGIEPTEENGKKALKVTVGPAILQDAVDSNKEKEAAAVGNTGSSEKTEEYVPDEVDWEGYEGGDALLAFTPKAFKNDAYFYQATVGVVYPEISCDVKSIEYFPGAQIEQKIMLTLKNDAFAKTTTMQEITVAGGLKSATVSGISQNGQSLSFTVTGIIDDSFLSFGQ